nr:hypothetical protein KitaXyl93_22860 [Kitasatospora sp. Xyl93]
MSQLPPLSLELERQRIEYLQLLRAGRLSPHSLPAVASAVERAVLARAWARTRDPVEGIGSRIYVLSVAGTHGRVKVGRASNVRDRIATHLNEYHCNGHGLVDAWISNPLFNAVHIEAAMHKIMRIIHRPSYRREEYPDGNFDRVCSLAADLDVKHSLTEEQIEFHRWEQQERKKKASEELLHELSGKSGIPSTLVKSPETVHSRGAGGGATTD